jgi:hypothetical protein
MDSWFRSVVEISHLLQVRPEEEEADEGIAHEDEEKDEEKVVQIHPRAAAGGVEFPVRVSGFGVRVLGLGFRVSGVGCRVQGAGRTV